MPSSQSQDDSQTTYLKAIGCHLRYLLCKEEKHWLKKKAPAPYLLRLLGQGKELANFTAPLKSSDTTMSISLFCRTLECLQTRVLVHGSPAVTSRPRATLYLQYVTLQLDRTHPGRYSIFPDNGQGVCTPVGRLLGEFTNGQGCLHACSP